MGEGRECLKEFSQHVAVSVINRKIVGTARKFNQWVKIAV